MNARANATIWFATHEGRLIWRDFIGMMTGGRPKRTAMLAVVVSIILTALHAYAAYLVRPAVEAGIIADKTTLLFVSGGLVMFFSLMFSQAIESVTRAYYSRSDLDLILSSPTNYSRLFEVRTTLLAIQTIGLSLLIASPVLNVLIVMDGPRWIAAYAVLIAFGALSTALAVWITLSLFRLVGTRRTRLIAQIIAAIVGAGFVIALQGVAIIFGQGITRLSLFRSQGTLQAMPGLESLIWLPAKASLADFWPLVTLICVSTVFLMITVAISARRFATDVMTTAGMAEKAKPTATFKGFRKSESITMTLCRKEWVLLERDPWLISQSLQQILYLVPPALLLWVNYGDDTGMLFVIVPVIVMAVGQLAGALAWLAISGEDAHELIETAPVAPKTVLSAKVIAVQTIIAVLVLPFALAMVFVSVPSTLWMIFGCAMASASAVMVQIMFRSQANRSLFRRRQVSSRVATLAEAMVSILWAATSGLAILGTWYALVPAALSVLVLLLARMIRA
ncbi:MAG: permease [Pseudomonadota bacterium]